MNPEEEIFKRYRPDFKKLEKYGFKKEKDNYIFNKLFHNNLFKAAISIAPDGKVSSTVYDIENGDEYLPIKVAHPTGSFIGEIIQEYTSILEDICDKCFIKKYFIYEQSNRITEEIIKRYGTYPEFLWKTFPGSGIFRTTKSKKWYLALLDVDLSRLQPEKSGVVEVANIKLPPQKIEKLIKVPDFYPAYHMNKKYWLTIIMNDTVADNDILELIEESKSLVE